MKIRPRLAKPTAAAAALLWMAGCSDMPSVDTTTAEATVKGVVKLDGKAASEGEITFDGSNYKRVIPPTTAPIGKDGSYSIKTVAGQNMVSLGGTLARKNGVLQHMKRTFNASAGENTYDFDVKVR